VLAFAGLRGSELRGLRGLDVDLVNPTLTVWQRADQGGTIGEAKSAAGYRTIPLMPFVVNALKEWKLACPLHDTGKKGADGNPVKDLWLMFPNGAGNVECHQHIERREWQPLQVEAGVMAPAFYKRTGKPKLDDEGNQLTGAKYRGLHALRHFFASWCLARRESGGLGLDMKTTQVRCGHSSIQVTMDTYAHLIPATDTAEQMAAAERVFLGA
jgi:integrase